MTRVRISRIRTLAAERVGRRLGRATPERLARDLEHDRDVALKALRPDLAESLGRERFLRE